MRMSIELVVVAVVILVVAMVVLTIFGTGMGPFGWFASNENLCISQYTASCQSTGADPTDWAVPKFTDSSGAKKSCSQLISCSCDKTKTPPAARCTGSPVKP